MTERTGGRRRCAIYTRKSTEEGLEQSFNTLDAQREACAAYIRSQVGEGWKSLPSHYDDGGYSGGNMDRPALKRLLADIDAGGVDVVIVYKVDRLTRSLTDFARIVERFEARNVSFVSVTQSFNTTSSMGRLTLNVLLSFAQFEREVTGERIRDKIAASKAKGLWMGGYPPLGYDPDGRTLAVNESEAETVRMIFQRYLDLGCVRALVSDLKAKGIKSKTWTTAKGRKISGTTLARGALYYMLRNRLYRGEIRHKGKTHPGKHLAIVPAKLFDAVQESLNGRVSARRERPTRPGGSPLTGLLFDSTGARMSPTHARGKSGRAHRYYVSTGSLSGSGARRADVTRVPAKLIEDLSRLRLAAVLGKEPDWTQLRAAIDSVSVRKDEVEIKLKPAASANTSERDHPLLQGCHIEPDGSATRIIIPCTLNFRGGKVRMLDSFGGAAAGPKPPNPTFTRGIARAHFWRERLLSGEVSTIAEIAKAEGLTEAFVRARLRLAYLSPDLVGTILRGLQPDGLTLEQIIDADFPIYWHTQRQQFGLE